MGRYIRKTRKNIQLLPLIKYPLLTNKTQKIKKNGWFTFLVDKSLSKNEGKKLFNDLLKSNISKLHSLNLPPHYRRAINKTGKKRAYKKIYIKFAIESRVLEILF